MRPSRVQTYMDCAQAWAKRSTCMRLNVGAVIVVNRNIVSHGYNGAPSSKPHCTGNDCPGKFLCQETVHAEENALIRMDQSFLSSSVHKDMYVTDSPCPACAEMIVEAGIRRLFFATPYRIAEGLDYLIHHGVDVYRVTPSGFVMEWKSRSIVQPEV